jgi:hypothetical protein
MRRVLLALAVGAALAQAGCGGDAGGGDGGTTTGTPLAAGTETSKNRTNRMKIRLRLEDTTTFTATLIDRETTRDFVSLLPLTLTVRDYAGTEKVSDLPRRLSTADAPEGVDPDVGDITYYAPWGNLAIFYRDFGYSRGLVKLGTIESGIEELGRMSGDFRVTIEHAD